MIDPYDNIPIQSKVWWFYCDTTIVIIYENGDIGFDDEYYIVISVEDMAEIVRRAKLFRDRRIAHLEKNK